MAGLLSGLEAFGLGKLTGMDLYAEPQEEQKQAKEQVKEVVVEEVKEQDFLFDKTYTCPACDATFKCKTVRTGKVRQIGSDDDLRPKYEHIDMLKYDVVLCPKCGCAALSRYFQYLASSQRKAIEANISKNFKARMEEKEIYSYEEALERYQLALANAIVKRAKASEKAYICLKTGWLIRGMTEELDPSDGEFDAKVKEYTEQEEEYLKNALEGFITARQSEDFPMCGMDQSTVDYIIASLATRFNQFDIATKLVSELILSKSVNTRQKDRAKELRDVLMKKIKENS